ncbi:tetraacyldisaccharide 4'-kinase [Oleiagrimonas soli]|uniref:Tetraacyldisaccharide 4'-kinase n=1 Tax=Oleiagrimonas soli TaxID=1543381 RepID=A0A099CYP2_9GAMM|nr:tetraacyldisaccharide 4'-kinase [Oleiagrimonas soli]KGI78140.1 tetraacyldisaccharide 4'-kinase [Oleiagrimonas soli]MBB6183410.1 tetraacyldisaccharide 4'-kinase [Oleiagrimonas soli]
MSLSDAVQRNWYRSQPTSLALRALSRLYGWLARRRRARFARHPALSVGMPVPVIVIGNLSVGGTGKTPLTIALVEALRAQGWHPGVVSRGYGGQRRVPELLGDAPDPAEVGDEPCLIRGRTGAPVAVGRDRPAAARLLVEAGVDVILADDGLQHYRLRRDIEICVIDGIRRFGNGWLLPAGPLREPIERLKDVDFRVCNGGVAQDGEVPMRLLGDTAYPLLGEERTLPLESLVGKRVHAVAAIGNPRRFFESLRAQRIDVIEHPFPDHHAFSARDLDFADRLPVLMTGKDAVKCIFFARKHWYSVPVRADLPDSFLRELTDRLRRAQPRPKRTRDGA